jgi:N,N'-diacetyllegionaminate synthase
MNIIANIGYNWWSKEGGSKRALDLVDVAFESGADGLCVPFFEAKKIHRVKNVADQFLRFDIAPELLYDIREKIAHKYPGKEFYVAPKLAEQVDYLENIGVSTFHIENGDTLYEPLLTRLRGKEVLLSTGYATFEEVSDAIEWLTDGEDEVPSVTLLHSTGKRPTPPGEMQLDRILDLGQEFYPMWVGLESFSHDRYLDYVAMAFRPVVIMRRIDLADQKGIETSYSLSPHDFSILTKMAAAMDVVNKPEFYSEEFVEGDFEARIENMRCEETDYTLPPER